METPEREATESSGSSAEEKRNAPTVSREKWRHHALTKLARGYLLIVATERKSANFYLPGKGYEMCAFHAAAQLVKEGVVVKAYDHHLGTAYQLAPSAETA